MSFVVGFSGLLIVLRVCVSVALSRPNSHTFTEIVRALRTSYQSRGFPKSVCDCFDQIAKGELASSTVVVFRV